MFWRIGLRSRLDKGLFKPMDYAEMKEFADGLLDDEAEAMARILSLRAPEPLDPFAERARGEPLCPRCGARMWRNGRDMGHQKWVCPACGETARSCSGGPAQGSKKKAVVWLNAIACDLHMLSLKETAEACGISLPQAFYIRQKMQESLREALSSIELAGRVEMDGQYFRINLKGTKAPNMPRESKKRGTAILGEPQVVVLWAIDENDNMAGEIVGLGRESRAMADKMLPHLAGCKTLVTDDRSCYEGFARDNGFGHVEIKSGCHANERGETMNEVNSLMADFADSTARFRGLSTRHLQGYVDRFLFQKMLRYAKEAMERPGAQIDAILRERSVITCREILRKLMPVDLSLAYGPLVGDAFKTR